MLECFRYLKIKFGFFAKHLKFTNYIDNYIEVKFVWNFIPPVNGASQGLIMKQRW